MTVWLRDNCEATTGWAAGGVSLVPARTANGFQLGTNGSAGRYLGGSASVSNASAQSDYAIVGFGLNWSSLASVRDLIGFYAENGAWRGTYLRIQADGSIQAYRASGNVLATSAPGTIVAGTWYYVEFYARYHDTAGLVQVRVNGTEVINISNVDTRPTSSSTAVYDYLQFGASGTPTFTIDDIYLATGSDATFLGPQSFGGGIRNARSSVRVAFTTAALEGRLSRQQLRVGTSPYDPNAAAMARQQLQVAVSPYPADTVVNARQQLRVAVAAVTLPTVKVWDGSSFTDRPLKTSTPGGYVDPLAVKTWNGSSWVP